MKISNIMLLFTKKCNRKRGCGVSWPFEFRGLEWFQAGDSNQYGCFQSYEISPGGYAIT